MIHMRYQIRQMKLNIWIHMNSTTWTFKCHIRSPHIMRCIYRFGMYAAHVLYIRPQYAIESRWPPRVRGMYAVRTPFAPWIRNGRVLKRDIIRSGIVIHTPYAPHVRHPCAIDTQHMRNSSAGDVPPNRLGDLAAYRFIFSYAVRALWHRRPVEQGH